MVGVNISHSYFPPGGAHITWVKIISHTGILLANIFWPSAILPSAYRYQQCTSKYLLAQYHFALSILVPASYWQIFSGPVPFCPQRTGTSRVPENIFWPSTILPSVYQDQYLTRNYLLAQYKFAFRILITTCYLQD